ncbi:hypothetical protein CC1G_07335 [Coprinopsis cinerea okayama7|uniref:Uncharacterized protein n=1 Tax=Coprinopsis cinerea (strain Okayama-7 / 130 / ATCC MYA-4618 / FGSC 9003) TaxID=240176 RepID=A8NNS8_COPC7|nr:hypothetical protein CC1G_07335 [Coprinopsis cinerea okayama7\|eukprot:XP_001835193.1 hypothetical protein CC1G_07335 [Coprinopsis cinerea okayama7\
MILLSLGLGLIAPLLPGLASHQDDIAQSLPFLKDSAPDLKTVPFISTRSAPLIAGQCALAILSAAILAIHPSADGVKDSRWRRFANKLKMAVNFLLFPEFLMWQAIRQQAGASELLKTFDPSLKWSKAHAHLIQMGGMVLHEVDFKFQFGRNPTPVKILSYQELSDLVQKGEAKWPAILEKDLAKLSAKHPFLTAFAIFQSAFVLARTFIRASHGLPISHLEVISSFYILAGWSLSALCWDKPYSIDGSIPIHRKITETNAADAVPYTLPIRNRNEKQNKTDSRKSNDSSAPSLPTFSSPHDQERKIVEIEEPRFQLRNSHLEKGIMLALDSAWWIFSDAAGMMDPDCVKTIHETEDMYPSLEYDDVDTEKFTSELALRPNRLYAYQPEKTDIQTAASTSNPVKQAGYSALAPMVGLVSAFAALCNVAAWAPSSGLEFAGLTEKVMWSGSASVAALSLFTSLAAAYSIPEKDGFVSLGFSYPIIAFSLLVHMVSRSFVLLSSVAMVRDVVTTALPTSMGSTIVA